MFAQLLHDVVGQHAQDGEIHGQLLGDSEAMELYFHTVKPGDHACRQWGVGAELRPRRFWRKQEIQRLRVLKCSPI